MGRMGALMEVMRWGYVEIPAAIYFYAGELELEPEDLGVMGAVFYAYTHRSKPLLHKGLEIGHVMQCYPLLSKNKLAWRLSKWTQLGLIEIEESTLGREFSVRRILLEPLFRKLEELVRRDHPELDRKEPSASEELLRQEVEHSARRIKELESMLEEERAKRPPTTNYLAKANSFKIVVEFIEQKMGNLISPEMQKEVNRWLNEFKCKPEYLIIMLELCFERGIYEPREITFIARGLRESSINDLEGMEYYFRSVVDKSGSGRSRRYEFTLEAAELGSFTGIDMQAEARRNMYEKWRIEWGFSHEMIMKAGEIMCQRTRSGGLEYMDRVLSNWRDMSITTLEEAERNTNEFRNRTKKRDKRLNLVNNTNSAKAREDVEIFVAPHILEELKTKA